MLSVFKSGNRPEKNCLIRHCGWNSGYAQWWMTWLYINKVYTVQTVQFCNPVISSLSISHWGVERYCSTAPYYAYISTVSYMYIMHTYLYTGVLFNKITINNVQGCNRIKFLILLLPSQFITKIVIFNLSLKYLHEYILSVMLKVFKIRQDPLATITVY